MVDSRQGGLTGGWMLEALELYHMPIDRLHRLYSPMYMILY
jgi:hypothetical protein